MKKLGLGLLVVALVAAIAIALLRTADTEANVMRAKYASADSAFVVGPDGLAIHYRDQGNSEGPAVLLIHGSNSSLHTWEPLIERLGDIYRLVSLDLPGHGLTGPHPNGDYRAAKMIEAVEAVLNETGVEQVFVLGNSMGGWVSWRLALAKPERVRALILANASGAPVEDETKGIPYVGLTKYAVGRWALTQVTPRSLVEKAVRANFVDQSVVSDEMVDRYWELLRYPGNRRAAIDRMTADRESEKWNDIGMIETPVLIVWGDKDVAVPVTQAKKFSSALNNSETIIYPDVGHLPMEEIPDQLAADIRDWLMRSVANREAPESIEQVRDNATAAVR